jgi:predicted nucleotidyltransferase
MSSRMACLKEHSEAIKAIAARHKALKIAFFGSVARGEDGPDSDVDFGVTIDKGTSLLELVGLQDSLATFLKMPVDVISMVGLKPRDNHIREEARVL